MVIRYHNLHQGTGISYSLSCFSCFPLISPKKESSLESLCKIVWQLILPVVKLCVERHSVGTLWLWESQNSVDSVLPAGPAFSWVESVRVSSALPQNCQCAKTSAFTLLSKSNKTFYSCLLYFDLSCAKWKTRVIGNYATGYGIYHMKALWSFWMDVSSWKTASGIFSLHWAICVSSRHILARWWSHCQWPEWWTQFFWSFPRLL